MSNAFKKIVTLDAPQAIGPYSQAIAVAPGQGLIFVSGQLPIDPKTGELVSGDIRALTKQVIDNIEAILKASGSSLYSVVRTEVFLRDLKRDFVGMNEEFARRFNPDRPPARQTVEVSGLPKDAIIEISCVAILEM
jgi:2-iminobutanoate/2-iminopropanoate deaminase